MVSVVTGRNATEVVRVLGDVDGAEIPKWKMAPGEKGTAHHMSKRARVANFSLICGN